jgi:hypothetical protein
MDFTTASLMTLKSVEQVIRSAILDKPINDKETGINEGLRRALLLVQLYEKTFEEQSTNGIMAQ